MTRRRFGAIGTGRDVSERQSITSAAPATPQAAMYWSMMPQRMPTKSFSARWQMRATATGSKGRQRRGEERMGDADFERRRGA